MKLRIVLPLLLWLGLMILLFLKPIGEAETIYFDSIPARSLVHGILFLCFSLFCMIAFKKNRSGHITDKYNISIILGISVFLMVISEVLGLMVGNSFRPINFLFDLLGAIFGIVAFALLYRTK